MYLSDVSSAPLPRNSILISSLRKYNYTVEPLITDTLINEHLQ
jgi:hypothetical protein